MSQKENAADRIRPFLKAMERSIRQARDERLSDSDRPEPRSEQPAARPTHQHHHHQDELIGESRTPQDRTETESNNDHDAADRPARLKARPKRPSAFDDYRSQSSPRQEAV